VLQTTTSIQHNTIVHAPAACIETKAFIMSTHHWLYYLTDLGLARSVQFLLKYCM